jgi:D-alanyl-D-alanine carboxypeptidase
MPNNRTTKEKVFAILFVFILFLFVGSLFGYIGYINKKNTEKLQEKVRIEKLEAKEKTLLSQMVMSDILPNEITAKSFLTMAISSRSFKKVINSKNPDDTLPIASVTKLMTAIVVLENIDLNTKVTATADYVGGDGTMNVLEIGKTYTAKELLYNMLIASDNDAAQLLASILGTENFVILMNKKAKDLNLIRTSFVNVTGLDPLVNGKAYNISSSHDLAQLLIYINKNYQNIFEISRKAEYNFCDINNYCKNIISTDQLLTDPEFNLPGQNRQAGYKIIGGKTGQTLLANKNLALITEPFDGIFLINIVLGSDDNFADTKTIFNHLVPTKSN